MNIYGNITREALWICLSSFVLALPETWGSEHPRGSGRGGGHGGTQHDAHQSLRVCRLLPRSVLSSPLTRGAAHTSVPLAYCLVETLKLCQVRHSISMVHLNSLLFWFSKCLGSRNIYWDINLKWLNASQWIWDGFQMNRCTFLYLLFEHIFYVLTFL